MIQPEYFLPIIEFDCLQAETKALIQPMFKDFKIQEQPEEVALQVIANPLFTGVADVISEKVARSMVKGALVAIISAYEYGKYVSQPNPKQTTKE